MDINQQVIRSISGMLDAFDQKKFTEEEIIACENAIETMNLVKNLKTPIVQGKCKVYDIETDSIHDLVSIDFESSRVVMKSKDYGSTSNTWDKVRIIQI